MCFWFKICKVHNLSFPGFLSVFSQFALADFYTRAYPVLLGEEHPGGHRQGQFTGGDREAQPDAEDGTDAWPARSQLG